MKLKNNGTTSSASATASTRPRRSTSRNRTPKPAEVDTRFEISTDFLTSAAEESDESNDVWEPPRQTLRRRPLRTGEVNDLSEPTPVSARTNSVRTASSASKSERSYTLSWTGSERRARGGIKRREIPRYENEPHPYGLEPREPLRESPLPQSTTSALSVNHRNIGTVYESGNEYQTVTKALNVTSSTTNANNNNKIKSRSSYLNKILGRREENIDHVFSSDSEAEGAEDEVTTGSVSSGSSFASQMISSSWRYCKKGISYFCSCVYQILMWCIVAEKWCLSGRSPESMSVGDHTTTNSEMNGFSKGKGINQNQSSVVFFTSFNGSSSGNLNQGQIGGQKKTWMLDQFSAVQRREGVSQETSVFSKFIGIMTKYGKMLLRILLVILLICLGYWLLCVISHESAQSGNQEKSFTIGHVMNWTVSVASAFFNKLGLLYANIPFKTLDLGETKKAAESAEIPILPPSVPVAALNEKLVELDTKFLEETKALKEESQAALAALELTKESIDALKVKIGVMEETLAQHKIRLNGHDQYLVHLEGEIAKIFGAMKASSAKEKTMEQIVDEVLSVHVGETMDGTPVTLKSLFTFLQEDRNRISVEIEELRKTAEHTEAEMDIDKVKEVVLPVLSREIEKNVAISCESKKCPEGSLYAGLSLEDIELMIKRAIFKYDADKTGLPDLALESAGGSILSTRCTKSSELRNSVISYWGFRLWSPPNTPRTIIQPGVVPGECWAFEGSVGDVVVKLAVPAVVTAFTLEHIPKTISRYGHIDSAPKHFQVLGLLSEHDTEDVHDYGTFTYQDNEEPLQYFPVVNATTRPYPIVELKVLSNHGNMRHTCIYRFRVHGAIDLSRSHGVTASTTIKPSEGEGQRRK